MDMRANRAIGACLQELRVSAGLTQVELAKRLNRPQSYISKIEMGERGFPVSELFAYSIALGKSAQEVVSKIEATLQDYSQR